MSTESFDLPAAFDFPPEGPDKTFADFLSQGQFKIQFCSACKRHVFYPRLSCPHCGAAALAWVETSGKGFVYSTSTPRDTPEGDYNISIIELAEGPRMMSRVVGVAPEAVRIGMSVNAFIGAIDNTPVVLFKPEETA